MEYVVEGGIISLLLKTPCTAAKFAGLCVVLDLIQSRINLLT